MGSKWDQILRIRDLKHRKSNQTFNHMLRRVQYHAKIQTARCWRHVTYKNLLQICSFFWGLAKPAQDALLWSIQSRKDPMATDEGEESSSSGETSKESGSSSGRQRKHGKTTWCLGNVPVCRRAFARMLGVGQGRLQRTRHVFQGLDERTLPGPWSSTFLKMFCCNVLHTHCLKKSFASLKLLAASCTGAQPKPALMTASVNGFMYKTYYSISETMPTRRGVKLNSCQMMVLLFFYLETQVIPQHARQVGNCFYFAGRWRGTNEITAGTSERCLGGTNNSDVETGSFKDGLQRTPSWKLEPTVLPLSGSLFGFETACSKQECVLRVHIAMATVLEVSA